MPKYTILIVDYDPTTLEALRSLLEADGHTVAHAKNGVEAIDAFSKCQPDLTLLEFMLPRKSGLEVCLELRSTPHGSASAIVIMSSRFRSRQYRSEARHRYRADEFVEKPLDGEKLQSLLDAFVAGRAQATAVKNTTEGAAAAASPRVDATEAGASTPAEAGPVTATEVVVPVGPADDAVSGENGADRASSEPAQVAAVGDGIESEITDRIDALLGGD